MELGISCCTGLPAFRTRTSLDELAFPDLYRENSCTEQQLLSMKLVMQHMQHMQPIYFAWIFLENLASNKAISVALPQGHLAPLDSATPHRQLSCKSTFPYWRHDLETQNKASGPVASCCFMLCLPSLTFKVSLFATLVTTLVFHLFFTCFLVCFEIFKV